MPRSLPVRPRKILPPPTTMTTSTPSWRDRKSTRLNSSHLVISYAVFCLKKKKKKNNTDKSRHPYTHQITHSSQPCSYHNRQPTSNCSRSMRLPRLWIPLSVTSTMYHFAV